MVYCNLSDKFRNFLISQKDQNSYVIEIVINLFLQNFSMKVLSKGGYNKVFNKIYSVSESDDGYIIINENQKLKLGRFIYKILNSLKIDIQKNDRIYIERFVDIYKSWYKSTNSFQFNILKGEQILNGYDGSYYARRNCSMLGNSCMNNKFNFLDIYVKNEDKVKLLVLSDFKNKIHGRALLWDLDNKPYQFMDRVYGLDNYVVNVFTNYAIENNFAYRDQENNYDYRIYLPNEEKKYLYSSDVLFKTKINTNGIKQMPYMDSLYIWDKWNKSLSNKSGKNGIFKRFKSTRGKISGTELKLFGIKIMRGN